MGIRHIRQVNPMHHAGLIICLALTALALIIAAGYANTRKPPD